MAFSGGKVAAGDLEMKTKEVRIDREVLRYGAHLHDDPGDWPFAVLRDSSCHSQALRSGRTHMLCPWTLRWPPAVVTLLVVVVTAHPTKTTYGKKEREGCSVLKVQLSVRQIDDQSVAWSGKNVASQRLYLLFSLVPQPMVLSTFKVDPLSSANPILTEAGAVFMAVLSLIKLTFQINHPASQV